jgi:hypothetical protein
VRRARGGLRRRMAGGEGRTEEEDVLSDRRNSPGGLER